MKSQGFIGAAKWHLAQELFQLVLTPGRTFAVYTPCEEHHHRSWLQDRSLFMLSGKQGFYVF